MAVAIAPLRTAASDRGASVAQVEDVSYWYPGSVASALAEITVDFAPGLTLVAGPSGGGKSTLLRLFDGLVPQFHGGRIAGRVTVSGLDAFRTPIARLSREAGIVFQDPETQSVYGTVEREIAFALENAGMARPEMHARVDEAMERLGIGSLRGRRLATLSGGERQRVQLAAVLVLRPPLLALDEPTSELDPAGAASVLRACRDLADGGTTVVVAEHRLGPLRVVADRVVALDGGRLVEPPAFVAPAFPQRPASSSRSSVAWELHDVSIAPARGLDPIVTGVDASGAAGEIVAVVGANGSGKTTLLRTIAGLAPPVSGRVDRAPGRVDRAPGRVDRAPGRVDRAPGRVAYLPQNPAALLHLPTVRAEVQLTLRRAGANGGAATDPGATGSILEALGLAHLADRYPRDLSGGERQRAALAAVLVGGPSIALLDEPTRGMDSAARRALVALVRRLAEDGASIVLATHDADLVAELADRVIELRDGAARVIGPRAEVESGVPLPRPGGVA